jgi:putative cell wall-binding protein
MGGTWAVCASIAPATASLIVTPTYTITANEPASPVVVREGSQRIADVVIQEVAADAIDDLDLTFTLSRAGTRWDTSVVPTVTASGGDAAIGWVGFTSPTVLRVTLANTSGDSPAEYRISNLHVIASSSGDVGVDITGATSLRSYASGLPVAVAMSTKRIGGMDRYATAALAYAETVGGCNANQNVAVLARGDIFPDAVVANYLAGLLHTGILLTGPDELPKATIDQLRVSGVYQVYVVGSTAAISQKVRDQIATTTSYICDPYLMPLREPIDVVNVPAGDNRYETAAEVAGYHGRGAIGVIDIGGDSRSVPLRTAVLANGEMFPDALAAGPMIYDKHLPLLLTKPDGLSPETAQAIRYLDIGQVIIVGGTPTVSAAIEAQVRALGVKVLRLEGSDRAGTAAEIAHFEIADTSKRGDMALGLAFNPSARVLARGDIFPDALVMGPLAGSRRIPLMLTLDPSTLGSATISHLKAAAEGEWAATPHGQSDAVLGPLDHLYLAGDPVSTKPATVTAALRAAATR